MQPNDNLQNKKNDAPAFDSKMSDLGTHTEPKKNIGMTIGLIILALLAAGGIGFGVWTYLSGNQKESGLNERINELETDVATKESKISELESSLSTLEEKAINQQQIDSDDTTAETGTFVKEIGECVGDSGTGPNGGGTVIIKCDVLTSNGEGKFVYDSDSNQLRIVMNQE